MRNSFIKSQVHSVIRKAKRLYIELTIIDAISFFSTESYN